MKTIVKWYAILDETKVSKYQCKIIKNKKELLCEADANKAIETHVWTFYWKENKIKESGEFPCKVIKEITTIEEF